MKLTSGLLTIGFSLAANADCGHTIRIAIVDTGLGFRGFGLNTKVCQEGHRDFSTDQEYDKKFHTKDKVPLDSHGHGTNIAGVIEHYANITNGNYCLIIIKYYSTKNFQSSKIDYNSVNERASVRALRYLNDIKPDVINYSGGGAGYDTAEGSQVRKYLDNGGIFVAAIGNDRRNLDVNTGYTYYPAMYDKRIITVGSIDSNGSRSYFSNYGQIVKKWEIGSNVQGNHLIYSGTSQATAVETGKIVGQLENKCVQ